MTRRLILASAGAGKSESIAKDALERSVRGETVLMLTYTINNQNELVKQICRLNKYQPRNIVIKGWFTFLLEDMIRPYQRCILPERVRGICFDEADPHLVWTKRGVIRIRKELNDDGGYNSRHFVTQEGNAHTTYLSKLASFVDRDADRRAALRLARIYRAVYVDEVQDLTGWDFQILESIANTDIDVFDCVGDFRQTIYRTSTARKGPSTNDDKLERFEKIGFQPVYMSRSWRCIQSICDLADLVHGDDDGYERTVSEVKEVPPEFADHQGIFAVSAGEVRDYLSRYRPVILRWRRDIQEELCAGHGALNFGEAKGLSFNRVLIIPTEKHIKFLSGDHDAFAKEATDESKNKLYVGITRARYSVAFLHAGESIVDGAEMWKPADHT